MAHLKGQGIGCAVYYPVGLHLQPCFADLGYRIGSLPETERAMAAVLSLPVYREIGAANGTAYPEVRMALSGSSTPMLLVNDKGEQIVSVAVPIHSGGRSAKLRSRSSRRSPTRFASAICTRPSSR